MSLTLALKPRMTEKTYALSNSRVYVFDVPLSSNKAEISDAVEKQFKVSVVDVRPLIVKGKAKRSLRIGDRRGRAIAGKRPDVKKAYVTLKEGDSIPIFAAIEEQEKAEAKAAEKAAKKASSKKPVKEETPEVKEDKPKRRFGRRKK